MKRFLLVLGMLLVLGAAPVHADSGVMKVNDLVEQAAAFDGQTVRIEGEVIGDVMIRGDTGWINVTDGTNDIGIWAPVDALRQIRYAGRYHQSGDRVRVTGEFRRADPEHGGDIVVRAASVEVLAAGAPVAHPIKAGRSLLAALSLGAAGVLYILRRQRQRA